MDIGIRSKPRCFYRTHYYPEYGTRIGICDTYLTYFTIPINLTYSDFSGM